MTPRRTPPVQPANEHGHDEDGIKHGRRRGFPACGNQRTEWDAGARFDFGAAAG